MPSSLPTVVRNHLAALRMLLVFTVITGIAYPLLVTGVAQAAFTAPGQRLTGHARTARPSAPACIGQNFDLLEKNPDKDEPASRTRSGSSPARPPAATTRRSPAPPTSARTTPAWSRRSRSARRPSPPSTGSTRSDGPGRRRHRLRLRARPGHLPGVRVRAGQPGRQGPRPGSGDRPQARRRQHPRPAARLPRPGVRERGRAQPGPGQARVTADRRIARTQARRPDAQRRSRAAGQTQVTGAPPAAIRRRRQAQGLPRGRPGCRQDLPDAGRGPPPSRARHRRRRRVRRVPRPPAHRGDARRPGDPAPGRTRVPGHGLHRDGPRRGPRPRPAGRPRRRTAPTPTSPAAATPSAGRTSRNCCAAGIDVVTTVNIQHLESLNDVVEKITGVPQRETVPDEVVRRADQIELVDMPAEALRRRMAHGNIYAPEKVDAALVQLLPRRQPHRAARTGPAVGRRPGRRGPAAVPLRTRHRRRVGDPRTRRGRPHRRARGRDADPPRRPDRRPVRGRRPARRARRPQRRTRRRLARRAGQAARTGRDPWAAPTTRCVGDHIPTALLDFARAENATQLVMGTSRRGRLSRFLTGRGVGETTVELSGDIDVHMVTHERARPRPPAARAPQQPAAGPQGGGTGRRTASSRSC